MEAPDKLFRVDGWLTDKYPPKAKSYIEYIRKDILLEWTKEMKRICKGAKPIEKAYQTVIEKIESL